MNKTISINDLKSALKKIVLKGGYFEKYSDIHRFTFVESYRVIGYHINIDRETHIFYISILTNKSSGNISHISLNSSRNICLFKTNDKKEIYDIMDIINKCDGDSEYAKNTLSKNLDYCVEFYKYKIKHKKLAIDSIEIKKQLIKKIFE